MKFKSDKFKSKRGGRSQLLEISCRKCNKVVLHYQKDGPGGLRRMYMDRILFPEFYFENQYKKISDIKPLSCFSCSEILAHPIVYKKEGRLAYRVFVDSLVKKKIALKDLK